MTAITARRGSERASVPFTFSRLRRGLWRRESIGLAGILLLATGMNVLRLGSEGYANSYYAAAVKSMLQSWRNFFFVSFDPGGFVTVDKPPFGFWVQTASAKLFGFHGWSLLLPQAVAGVASVAVLFIVVRRVFGSTAGLLAALALAVSPVSVATNRNNTIDSQLVLVVLLASWAVLKATESGRLRWLLAGMALVGIGFNIKMLEAYLVLPALVAVYFLAAPHAWWKRILHLGVAAVVLVAVSFSWVAAVDLTPASQRPYVGSSQHNSELELALGYNGLQRLLGGGHGGAASQPSATRTTTDSTTVSGTTTAANTLGGPPAGAGPGGGGGPGGTSENGPVGAFRLLDSQLGGQIGWLIPVGILGLLAAWKMGVRRRPDRWHQSLILWGTWFLTGAVFFSKALFFHRYYLSMLAPAVAALFGIGAVALWQAYRLRSLRGWLLPVTLAVTAGVQAYILHSYAGWSTWMTPLVVVPCAAAALVLLALRLPPARRMSVRIVAGATALGLLALLVAPTVWSGDTVRNNAAAAGVFGGGPAVAGAGFGGPGGPPRAVRTDGTDDGQALRPPFADDGSNPPPTFGVDGGAGASPQGGPGGFAPGGPGGGTASKQLEQFLLTNQGSTKFLVAVPSSMTAEQFILDTGKAVMAIGGFSGSDPILTADSFAALVKDGQVRFVQLGGMGGPGGGASTVSSWVQANCTVVSAGQIQGGTSSTATSATSSVAGGQQLYDCAAAD